MYLFHFNVILHKFLLDGAKTPNDIWNWKTIREKGEMTRRRSTKGFRVGREGGAGEN